MITAYLRPDQKEKIDELSKRTRVPAAEYLREGIDLVLDRYREVRTGQQEMELEPDV